MHREVPFQPLLAMFSTVLPQQSCLPVRASHHNASMITLSLFEVQLILRKRRCLHVCVCDPNSKAASAGYMHVQPPTMYKCTSQAPDPGNDPVMHDIQLIANVC